MTTTTEQWFLEGDHLNGPSEGKTLNWCASLSGPKSLRLGDAAAEVTCRYDWMVGLALPAEPPVGWDWTADLAHDGTAVVVQLLVDSTVLWIETSANLLALYPSRDTRSWFERNGRTVTETLSAAISGLGVVCPGADVGSKALSHLANSVPSGNDGQRNWYLYRFLDPATRRPAIEWNMEKRVLEEYGPLIRGSVTLTFPGPATSNGMVRVGLRAGVRFKGDDPLEYRWLPRLPTRPSGSGTTPKIELKCLLVTEASVA
jgi:hypothetical protein